MSNLTGLELIMSTPDADTHRTSVALKNETFQILATYFTPMTLVDLGETLVIACVADSQSPNYLLYLSSSRTSASWATSIGDDLSTSKESVFVPLWTGAGLPGLAAAVTVKD